MGSNAGEFDATSCTICYDLEQSEFGGLCAVYPPPDPPAAVCVLIFALEEDSTRPYNNCVYNVCRLCNVSSLVSSEPPPPRRCKHQLNYICRFRLFIHYVLPHCYYHAPVSHWAPLRNSVLTIVTRSRLCCCTLGMQHSLSRTRPSSVLIALYWVYDLLPDVTL